MTAAQRKLELRRDSRLRSISSGHHDAFNKEMVSILEDAGRPSGLSIPETFRSFITMAACALSMGMRESDYRKEAERFHESGLGHIAKAFAFLVEAMEVAEFVDLLGPMHMEVSSTKAAQRDLGEFYTPWSLSRASAAMLLGTPPKIPEDRPFTLLEPAAGSGGMVLAVASHLVDNGLSPRNMKATLVDVSPLAYEMAIINTTLNGIPAQIIQGNALSLEVRRTWRNIHWWSAIAPGSATEPNFAQPSPIPDDEVRYVFETVQGSFNFEVAA